VTRLDFYEVCELLGEDYDGGRGTWWAEQVSHALHAAHDFAEAGIPIFVAYPDQTSTTGYRLPKGWQNTIPNPRYIDAWRPGMALCAVMGHGIDLVDLDPRNGFDPSDPDDALTLTRYAVARTPSDGAHYFVASMGVRSHDNVLPGVDVKAGDANGQGRGFAFLPPTQRISKTTGELKPYLWVCAPTLDELKAAADDRTGEKLAELVRLAHGSTNRNGHEERDHFKPSPWDDVDATIANNTRHGAVHKLASALRGRGGWRTDDALAYMREVVWPKLDQTRGGHPYTEAELEADVRDAFTRYDDGPSEEYQTPASTVIDRGEPVTLDQCHDVFRRWLGDEYDLDVLDAVLCTAAVEQLDGDPAWLLVVAGSGNAKTETVSALSSIGAVVVSTISSDAALLSGTPKRDRAKDATGGLLRKIGARGLIVVKDVTSILSTSRETRGAILAALREIHDGRWGRDMAVDGGRSLVWEGRLVIVGAVTTAWDQAHEVIATMGDRFVLVRADSTTGRGAARRKAIGNTGSEQTMRAELGAAVTGVMAGIDTTRDLTLSDDEAERIGAAADLVTLARTAVMVDYRGDVIDAHAPEMPTRFAKQLTQIIRGAVALGIDRAEALRLAIRCARDSMPPLRLGIVDDLADHPHSTPSEIRRRLDKPRATIDRQCQALHMLGVLTCDEVEYGEQGRTRWHYSLAGGINPDTLKSSPDLSVVPPSPQGRRARAVDAHYRATDISGEVPPQVSDVPPCYSCAAPLDEHAGPDCDIPVIHTPPDLWSSST
jgi:hypothetical protein